MRALDWIAQRYRLHRLRWHQRHIAWLEGTRDALEHEIIKQHHEADRCRAELTRGSKWKRSFL